MRISVICFTDVGWSLAERLATACHDMDVTRCRRGELSEWTSNRFSTSRALVFIGSVGIAVRAIAPLIVSKTTDPAVVVIDEQGQFTIPILSGHIGQANTLAHQLADIIGATPVITTATDTRGQFAVDDWATKQGLKIANPAKIKTVSSKLLSGHVIRLATQFPISGTWPDGVVHDSDSYDVIITCDHLAESDHALHLVPPVLTAGIGCKRGTTAKSIEEAFSLALSSFDPLAVAGVATIDLKANEPGLLAFCADHQLDLHVFTAEELNDVQGDFTGSDFVTSVTGVNNVCERAAVAANNGYLVTKKTAHNGVTIALALTEPHLHFDDPDKEKE